MANTESFLLELAFNVFVSLHKRSPSLKNFKIIFTYNGKGVPL